MDPRHRFDLERELASWHQSLAAHEALTPERAAELKTHLREEIAALQARGLDLRESFLVATLRLGDPAELAGQFTAADPAGVWRNRIFWMVVGLLVAQAAQTFLMVLGSSLVWLTTMRGQPELGYGVAWFVPLLSIAAMLVLIRGLAAGRWPRFARLLEAFCSRQSRFPWQFILLAALPALGLLILGAYAYIRGQGHFVRPAPVPMLLGPALFVIWPFLLAILAAIYAPRRMPPVSADS
jgi:hypothetical protein